MEEIKLQGLDETIYKTTLENGLRIYVWTNKKVNTFKGTITFLIGSEDINYKIGKKKIHDCFGIPHYLEHILCQNEKGGSILGDFQALGSYSNASTYAYRTTFEFIGNNNLQKNIELLLHMTQDKVFQEEPFERERGAILEESRRCEDSIDRLLYIEINKMLYKNYPNKEYGVGSQEDIKKITLEDLKRTYANFYHPKNSFVVITGNVNPCEIEEWISQVESKKEFSKFKEPTLLKYKEPASLVCKEREIKASVEIPIVAVALKVPLNIFGEKDLLKILDSIDLVLASNFGGTSNFREELLNQKLITTLSSYVEKNRDYLSIVVKSKTKYPKEVSKRLQEKLSTLQIKEEELLRKKKCAIANMVRGYEDVEEVNDYLTYSLSKFRSIFVNEKEVLENLDLKAIEDIINTIDFKKMATLIVMPRE